MITSKRMTSTSYSLLLAVILILTLSGDYITVSLGLRYNISEISAEGISAETPKVILQQGTVGTSTIYINNTSAKVSISAPAPIPTYFPNNYGISTGTHISGSVPASVQTVDTDYFIVKSSGTDTSAPTYNPSGYNLLGSTKLVSGTLSDLQSDNSGYMQFRGYVSATSTTSKTDAFTAYRSNTGANLLSSPKNQGWDGDTAGWNGENEMALLAVQ